MLAAVDGDAESLPTIDLKKAEASYFREELVELCQGISIEHIDQAIQLVSEMQEVVVIGKEAIAQLIAIKQKADPNLHDAKQEDVSAKQEDIAAKQEDTTAKQKDAVVEKESGELIGVEKRQVEAKDELDVANVEAKVLEKQIGVINKEAMGLTGEAKSVYKAGARKWGSLLAPTGDNSSQTSEKKEDSSSSFKPK